MTALLGSATNLVSTSFSGISIAGISAPWFQQFLDQTEIAIRIPAFGLYLFERNPAYRHCWLSQMQFFFNSLIALFSPAFAPVFSESGITGYPLRKFKVC